MKKIIISVLTFLPLSCLPFVPHADAAVTKASLSGYDTVAGKTIYDRNCSLCHASGVMNAPKPGDKAAWSARIAKGMSVIVKNTMTGKGAMPPKGGMSALTDRDAGNVVAYMVKDVLP